DPARGQPRGGQHLRGHARHPRPDPGPRPDRHPGVQLSLRHHVRRKDAKGQRRADRKATPHGARRRNGAHRPGRRPDSSFSPVLCVLASGNDMNLDFTPEERAFREEMRAFMRARLPAHIRAKVMAGARLSRADYLEWQRILHAHGYSGHNWPARFGGPGWTPVQQYIFEEEMALAGGPRLIPFGIKMVAPVIMEFGSAWQQEYFLPRIRSGEHWWCQGYSEPGAGSDLASLKTRAERKGGRYIVNGQKTWTTYAQYADWIFCLVRTGSGQRPQESISFLLIDMKSPGVSVRPIRLNDGTHDVNDVWFENVEVPVEHLVGEENRGWTYAKFLLGHERANIAGVGIAKRELGLLKRLAAGTRQDGRRLIEDPRFADRIARLELELMALELTNLRVISAEQENRAP